MKEINPKELKSRLDRGEEWQVIDVREEHELDICKITDTHIPMGEIVSRANELRQDCSVVIHCRSGKRAEAVIHTLEEKFDLTNLYNLTGGILGWAEEVDINLERY